MPYNLGVSFDGARGTVFPKHLPFALKADNDFNTNYFTEEEKRALSRLVLKHSRECHICDSVYQEASDLTVFIARGIGTTEGNVLFTVVKKYDSERSGMPYQYRVNYNGRKLKANITECNGRVSCNFIGLAGLVSDIDRVLKQGVFDQPVEAPAPAVL